MCKCVRVLKPQKRGCRFYRDLGLLWLLLGHEFASTIHIKALIGIQHQDIAMPRLYFNSLTRYCYGCSRYCSLARSILQIQNHGHR